MKYWLIRRMTALYGTSFDDLEDEESGWSSCLQCLWYPTTVLNIFVILWVGEVKEQPTEYKSVVSYTLWVVYTWWLSGDAVSKKPTGIQDQVATDERGRRRFHGAFTGGFSAGYFNTVGSKHGMFVGLENEWYWESTVGWAPSEFRSSRDERSDNSRQRAEDYMDEEVLVIFHFSPS